ncbi:EutP/PduV family microcompartment system protein [uncultured Desulfuromusa sp.]|uniref:EutP/PduV family microcompartment system protein n=1 Tax=uncultured Desulfuromusa sp. TaxID=219183 RepID=UPI002AA6AB8E|nr:EutP/PduV family microcompartment system protein [uncultured Desulfuromusa sp.]
MNKVLLIGKTGSGKTTLIQSFLEQKVVFKKTQAITFTGMFVDSPGEFLENRRLYPALLTSSVSCNIVALIQDATAINSVFPPNFSSMFKKRIIGVVTKVDKQSSNPERAEKFLRRAGVAEIIRTSAIDKTGLSQLKTVLIQAD